MRSFSSCFTDEETKAQDIYCDYFLNKAMQKGLPFFGLFKIAFSTFYHTLLVPSENMNQGLQRQRPKAKDVKDSIEISL